MSLVQIKTSQGETGKKYWRSLGELYDKPEFRDWVDQEFAGGASEMLDSGSRRTVLKLMAASFGLAGLTACRRPVERILPAAKGIEDYIPGIPQFYATVFTQSGVSTGVLVEVHDGRPTKIDGNPDHPFSLGAINTQAQASLLSLYDPDRSRHVLEAGRESDWKKFEAAWKSQAAGLGDGSGLRILSQTINSPSVESVRDALLAKYPKAKWVEYEPVNRDNVAAGAALAFGPGVAAHPEFDKAKVILSLDYDFLGSDSPTTIPTRQFAAGRRVGEHAEDMNRLYVVEGQFSLTGGMAEHRLRSRVSEVKGVAMEIASALGALPEGLKVLQASDKKTKFIAQLVKDLKANQGKALVVAGPRQPAVVHALAHLMNQTLGAPVSFADAPAAGDQLTAIRELASEISSGAAKTLVILGGNPAYNAPAELKFEDLIKRVPLSVHLGLDIDETARAAKWHLPEAHYLEAWGDGRALDGTLSVQQPVIEPLYGGKSVLEVAAMIADTPAKKGYDIVRTVWKAADPAGDRAWRQAVHNGLAPSPARRTAAPGVDAKRVAAAAQSEPKPSGAGMEVSFYPSNSTYDGRWANNGWLVECPDPITKIVWGNAALVSPKTARDRQLSTGDEVKVTVGSQTLNLPVLVQAGLADNAIAISLGYGRKSVGRIGTEVGFNAYALRTSNGFWAVEGASIDKTGETRGIVTTQEHHRLEEPIVVPKALEGLQVKVTRPLVREATIEEYKKNPKVIEEMLEHPPLEGLYPDWKYDKGNQWGMSIDLNACTGCNACLVACQAENNIPVVGREKVLQGREMHWIRLDRYYTGSDEDPQVLPQPVNCMQCENAPCENVCPVVATAHSPEGLNDMAYNRCVGTRYCANNCPYKVRRFNYVNYHRNIADVEKLVHNPDVSVRMRGVMEKCTYCVQRIQEGKRKAKVEGRPLKDGEIITACQQACPAEAIVFGNINDPESRVSKLKKQERNYAMLAEINVKPRTTYLAKLRNPNPELA